MTVLQRHSDNTADLIPVQVARTCALVEIPFHLPPQFTIRFLPPLLCCLPASLSKRSGSFRFKTQQHLLGIEHTKLTVKFQGLDARLTNVSGRVVHDII